MQDLCSARAVSFVLLTLSYSNLREIASTALTDSDMMLVFVCVREDAARSCLQSGAVSSEVHRSAYQELCLFGRLSILNVVCCVTGSPQITGAND